MLLEDDGGDKGYEGVAIDWTAFVIYNSRTVNVCIKDDSEVCMAALYGFANGCHCVSILRVWDMIRETSIRVKKLTALGIGTESLEYILKEASITITCIHDDVHTGERVLTVFGIDAFTDIVSKMLGIGSHEIKVGTMTRCTIIREIFLLSDVEYGSDILNVESTFRSEEFESVTVERQMTCRNHY